MSYQGRRNAAFTLIEVMIAIAIVLVLIGIVAINVLPKRDQAKIGAAKIGINRLQAALEDFNLVYDRYPSDEEGLAVLWDKSALVSELEGDEAKWQKFVKSPQPNDPWGRPWGYRAESEHGADFDLWSNGPDGEEGTEDDVVSWDSESDAGASESTGEGESGG